MKYFVNSSKALGSKILTLLFISILMVNCKGKTETTETSTESVSETIYEKIDPKLFVDKIYSYENEGAQIIDVRTPGEFSEQHIDNAINININDGSFDAELAKLDKSKPTFVYCLSGGRSSSAAAKMQELGFKEIYEMEGGMMKYNAEGLGNKVTEKSEISTEEYKKLIDSDKTVVVDFYAEWCGPCKRMAPYLEKMKVDLKDKVTIIRIDVDKNESLANALKVENLPTVMIYKNKKVTWQNEGYITEEELKKHL